MTKKTKTVDINVAYPKSMTSARDKLVKDAVGTECTGSGCGPGGRDMDFTIAAKDLDEVVERLANLHTKTGPVCIEMRK